MSAAGRTQQSQGKRRKRSHPPVYNAIGVSFEDKDNDFVCPICFDMIEEAHMTKCGHSFCYKCIHQTLEQSNRCPKCNYVIEKQDQIFPNFLLNELILKQKQRINEKKIRIDQQNSNVSLNLEDVISDQDNLDIANINLMLEVLAQKKQQIMADCRTTQNQILKEFLQKIRTKKQQQLEQLTREMNVLDEDCARVDLKLQDERKILSHIGETVVNGIHGDAAAGPSTSTASPSTSTAVVSSDNSLQEGFNGSKNVNRQRWLHTTMAARRKKVNHHFDDLEQCYFSTRLKEFGNQNGCDGLDEFTDNLSKFIKFSSFRPLASLSYASDIYNGSSIVSSIDFDRDCEFFAIAGVTKKIKVFEYGSIIRDAVDVHYPVNEMLCNSKISCVTWNSYHKGQMASADYEGTITLWDALAGVKSRLLQEHEKRCWSVDFNRVDPKLLASGSDDSKVKLWSTNTEHSVACLEAKANVCCVKFNPESRYHLAFGSADHCVHYFDLRNLKQPVVVFKGHRKAVSYAKFVNTSELVSASTDSQLKLWSLTNKPHCLRTFKGHVNEKNFVGLASDGDYIACGSENNSLCIYYKGLSKQLLNYKFDTVRSTIERDRKDDEANEFVSAVCWRPGSNVVVAANSQGIIKVLELV
ncbi:E3 ubiquitin-protein ligase COP1-like isoform X2 [Tubulanus polymorphus]|uniref:E3 ubiquitin-protein ligase COP1-like isoform X2 n=1 Tax=Tubulanus polymorphus TaxID=672921 RepID=UPI003DA49C9F